VREFGSWLEDARGTKNLPGRKSDVQECQWLMKLHTYGLLRNSFRSPEEIRAERTIWRLRDRLVQDAGRAIQQIQKVLTTMNIRLANAIRDVSGVTGMAIIRAILSGERDPRVLAKLRDARVKAQRGGSGALSGGHCFEGIRLRDVAAKVGIDHSRLHDHFCTKSDVVAAVLDLRHRTISSAPPPARCTADIAP
jgi:hypothetical protein